MKYFFRVLKERGNKTSVKESWNGVWVGGKLGGINRTPPKENEQKLVIKIIISHKRVYPLEIIFHYGPFLILIGKNYCGH